MASSTSAPSQSRQPSRKGKRAWRKHVDLSEVQSGLDTLRDELIQGGVVAEKSSDELFAIDTAGAGPHSASLPTRSRPAPSRPLKADQILGARSAIPAVDSRKRAGLTDGVAEPRTKRHRTPYVSPREYERLRRIGRGATGSTPQATIADEDQAPTRDPWAVEPAAEGERRYSFLEPARAVREPATLKSAPVSLLASGKTPPAVAQPKGGISYNPSFVEWDGLLTAEGEKEAAAEFKRQKQARADAEREARIIAAQEEEAEGSVWEGFESEHEERGAERPEWARPKKIKIKTRAERNKIRRRKEVEREDRLRTREKAKEAEAKRVKAIAMQVRRKERQDDEVSDESASDLDNENFQRHVKKKLLPPKSLELVLPDELQDSLRRLKPEGNLLRERFRNAVLQGRVEPRRPIVHPRKPKRFLVEKWSYQDFSIAT